MRKRPRKKLRLREFQELGFELRFRLDLGLTDEELDPFTDKFLVQASEANGLMCGGRCGHEWDVFVTLARRGSVTEQHVTAIREWLTAQGGVRDVEVGELVDAWHSV